VAAPCSRAPGDVPDRPGNPDGALGLLGYGQTPGITVETVAFTPRRVRIGGRVTMTFELKSTSTRQQLLVDVAVHFVKARGVGAPKVFKLGCMTLGPRQLKTRSRLPFTRRECRGPGGTISTWS
jgi:hypothetical protein